MRKILIPLIALLFVATACHKDNVEPRHMTVIQTGRTYYFYDSGGPNGDYSNNENYTFTFFAPSGKRVKIVFNSFSTESGYDYLTISGSTYSGTNSPGTKYSSYGGSITVSWHSDGSITSSGWSATVTAVD